MFRRRVKILLWAIALAWLVLVARLAQLQVYSHDPFNQDDYTKAGGNHSLETVRGGIYGHWGTPLAYEVPSFDMAVYYSQLLPFCSEPWNREQVRELLDEYAAIPETAVLGDDEYRRLWEDATARAALGTAADYVRRRLGGETRRDIKKGDAPARNTGDWRPPLARLTGCSVRDLTEKADGIIRKVERMEARVRSRPGMGDIRIRERYEWHVVMGDVDADVAAILRTEPQRFPAVRLRRTEEPVVKVLEGTSRRYHRGGLAPHVIGRVSLIDDDKWDRLLADGCVWQQSVLETAATWKDPGVYGDALRLYRMDDSLGVGGIEEQAEDRLRGRRGYVRNQLVFGFLTCKRESETVLPEPGEDVVLTLREDFQEAANGALAWAVTQNEGLENLEFSAGALVLVDVRNGAVLAAATWPSFHFDDYKDYEKRYLPLTQNEYHPFLFRPTQGVLPTGSIFKVITAIAALEEGKITPSDTFTCYGAEEFRFGRSRDTFECTGHHGSVSLLPAIERSCNIYFYHAGLAAGGEALSRWAEAFGLGQATGVDLPQETRRSQVPRPATPFAVINLSIGQGNMRCTPLQVARMMAAVANGGVLYTPHFIDYYRKADGTRVEPVPPERTQISPSPRTLGLVREGMRRVVEGAHGTAGQSVLMRTGGIGLDRFRVAGKSGTAETDEKGENHAWFAGYFPHDDPKIAFVVVSEKTGKHGGEAAGRILENCLERIWDAVESMP